ncbi:MAG: hypothetical protein ACFFBL_10885 [Promethearchaeota archaeon]
MEGVSGEGVRRRKEYSEETEGTRIAELTATELVCARERALDASESDEQAEVSARDLVEQVVRELREEERNEGEISRRLEDALEELDEMERASESTEEKLRKVLEEVNDREKEVIDGASEEERETKESRFGEIRTKEDFDGAVENHSELKLREEQEEQMENPPSGIQELDESWVRDVTSDLESREWNQENLAELLSEVSQNLPESSRAFYIDVTRSLEVTSKELDSFEQGFHQARESLDGTQDVRFGFVEERLYVWKPNLDSTGLENVYDSLYYYFRDRSTFEEYIEDVGNSLGLQDMNQGEILKHLRELVPQMVVEDSNNNCINPSIGRIRGDHVNMMNDISGKMLSSLEGEISKITKPSGKGGISNPRFPEGESYEVALSRLTAVAISDCHLKPNGTLEYAESEMSRIKIVERELQVFGDIRLSPKFRHGDNVYLSYLPTPLGVMLERHGIPSGDRSVQNPGLISVIKEFSPRARCALIEDLVPQDGTISGKRIQWTHTNVLDAAGKSEVYGIEPKVGAREITLIKDYGKKESHSWVLTYGKLRELRYSEIVQTRKIAEELWNCVFENPNRLIQDQIEIVRSLGIEYRSKPYTIRFHERTCRVSVAWTAEPETLLESVKLGMMAPPNDVVKKEIMRDIIKEHPKYVAEAMKQIKGYKFELNRWWEVEK